MTSSVPSAATPQWDFYVCWVDDALASIYLDLAYGPRAPVAGADVLYACAINLLVPDVHGMGDDSERASLGPVEDAVQAWANERGLHYVGRLRNHGVWQLTLYGPASMERELRRFVEMALQGSGRAVRMVAQVDADWSYFRTFLWPDPERMEWMRNRRTVDTLAARGGSLERSRRIDHWAYFPTAAARDAFVRACRAQGFHVQDVSEKTDGECRFVAQVHRVDSVQLDSIHAVTLVLTRHANTCGGTYDGWETSVDSGDPA